MVQGDKGKTQAWYVVATKSKQEAVAHEHLSRQDYKAFLPQLRLKKRRLGKWQEVIEPTFPGYIFVALELGVDDMGPIRSTQGCRELVRFGQKPAVVPNNVIQALERSHQLQASDGATKYPFSPGDMVTIDSGPFQGLSAIYAMAKGADRVQLLIAMLGKEQRVNLSVNDISAC